MPPYRDGRDVRASTPVFDGAMPGHDAVCWATIGEIMTSSLTLRAGLVSVLIFIAFMLAWHLAVRGTGTVQQMDPNTPS